MTLFRDEQLYAVFVIGITVGGMIAFGCHWAVVACG